MKIFNKGISKNFVAAVVIAGAVLLTGCAGSNTGTGQADRGAATEAQATTEAESKTFEDEAYAFAEDVVKHYNDGDGQWLYNNMSQQVKDAMEEDIIDYESSIRVDQVNYKTKYKIVSQFFSTVKAAYGVTVGMTRNKKSEKYSEENLMIFKENGKWVFGDDNTLDAANYKTEPETRKELLQMYPELKQEGEDVDKAAEQATEADTESEEGSTEWWY